jgi:hypothetical protein
MWRVERGLRADRPEQESLLAQVQALFARQLPRRLPWQFRLSFSGCGSGLYTSVLFLPENEFCCMNWSEFGPEMKAKSLTLFGATTVPPMISGLRASPPRGFPVSESAR